MSKLKLALFGLFALLAAGSWQAYDHNFNTYPQIGYHADGAAARLTPEDSARCFQAKQKSWSNPAKRSAWRRCQSYMHSHGALQEFNRDFALMHALGGGSIITFLTMIGMGHFGKRPARHLRGPNLLRGTESRRNLAKALRNECKRSGKGLEFPPGLQISRDRESRHMMITGGVGSGKTQTMRHLMVAAMARGDKVLILDTKGDVTASAPHEYTLIAPQDARSDAWDIAKDCRVEQDARELAARFIPKSDDPMWAEAARGLFAACVICLQTEQPGKWNWMDLYKRLCSKPEGLKDLAERYYPPAAQLIDDPTSKTALSILTTFRTFLPPVAALAHAWGHQKHFTFSLADWLEERSNGAPIILQRDGRYPQLSNAWISALVGLLSSKVGSPSLEESEDRRIWLFLDEFPQLERMEDFTTLLDLGRSKGICVVLATQDTSQIRIRYGRGRTNAWQSMVGTHIICRMNVGEGADDVSRALGVAEIEEQQKSRGYSGGHHTNSTSMLKRTRPVITSSEIASELGPHKKGVRVLLVGVGQDYHILDLPYIDTPKVRDPHEPSRWTTENISLLDPPSFIPEAATGLISKAELEAIRELKPEDKH